MDLFKFAGPEPSLGVSRQNIRRKTKCWMDNQRLARWQGLGSTQRQVWELILGPNLGAMTTLLSLNRTQSRVVIPLLTGHNTLRRHQMGPTSSPLCRRCEAQDETSATFSEWSLGFTQTYTWADWKVSRLIFFYSELNLQALHFFFFKVASYTLNTFFTVSYKRFKHIK
jgi:hypothetical protein